ncbi:MAG: hypothetical protein J6D18_05165 [Erysipelotrichaceae bacterium]|nr:hypothetical protein [Erysipelotrichaceae bacterium]
MSVKTSQLLLKIFSIIDFVIGIGAVFAFAMGQLELYQLFYVGFDLVEAFFLWRASQDREKVLPAWYTSAVLCIFSFFGLMITVLTAPAGNSIPRSLSEFAGNCITFWCANNIKKTFGKRNVV